MQVVKVCVGNRLSAASAEIRTQIIWLMAIHTFSKIKVVPIFPIWIFQSLLKPFVLTGAVVYYQVHNNVHVSLFCF